MVPESNGKLYFIIKKALYGLLESAKLWYDTISNFLIEQLGFTQLNRILAFSTSGGQMME